eukprot:TRINITY_DN31185_c0_g1_i1.p1 TRINITY_DN31185_c0_g1~~TRINITY_DN31185_c0_g1_i1.p1  ORF type:complete len:143 (+),score=40.01 TRINITY_DN31185_c0_g1_i1:60-431(+)
MLRSLVGSEMCIRDSHQFKVVLIGPQGTGKSTIFRQLVSDSTCTKHMGRVDCGRRSYSGNGTSVTLSLWDTQGPPSRIPSHVFQAADAVMVVCDASRAFCFDTGVRWLRAVAEIRSRGGASCK